MTSIQTTRRLALTSFVAIAISGCAATRTRESTGEYFDDTVLTSKVKAALLKDPVVSGLNINVETFKGTVQLSGFAKNDAERRQASVVARSVGGVKDVRNDVLLK